MNTRPATTVVGAGPPGLAAAMTLGSRRVCRSRRQAVGCEGIGCRMSEHA
jgi:cation diffusion facilitator CzcD-associated flavoprotein CzcO